jgi:quinol monooxygenase YgiN
MMKTLIVALVALGAATFQAQAQNPAAGSDQVYWVLTVTTDHLDQFKPLVAKLVAATKNEPGALEYEYTVADDGKTIDIVERYSDSKAALAHLTDNFVPNFSKEFFALATPARFVIYGAPSDDFKKAVDGFHPIYMTAFDGFTR